LDGPYFSRQIFPIVTPIDYQKLLRMSRIKAVAMFSGGLDSILAVKAILNQDISVYGINFITPFLSSSKQGRDLEARSISEKFHIPLRVKFLGNEYIEMVKHPRYGYGRNMNPCIDCRLSMLHKTIEYMKKIDAQFIITGEVLGERPMTQNRNSIKLIEKESGLDSRILRPLSAKLFEPTIPEQRGWVNRDKLYAIEGRSRKPQIELAAEFGISDYPTPAGGCLLTDSNFAKRLKDAFEHKEDSLKEMLLLKFGRHFRLPGGAKVVVGREEKENKKILLLGKSDSIYMEAEGVPGPITLLLRMETKEDIENTGSICLRYSDYQKEKGKVTYWKKSGAKTYITVKKTGEETLNRFFVQ